MKVNDDEDDDDDDDDDDDEVEECYDRKKTRLMIRKRKEIPFQEGAGSQVSA